MEQEKEIRRALEDKKLLLILGNCAVKYHGRAASKLSQGDRLLIIKPDGTFLVHQKNKAKAVNYQGPGAVIEVSVEKQEENGEKKEEDNKEGKEAGKETGKGDGKEIKEVIKIIATRKKPVLEIIEARFNSIAFLQSFEMKDDNELHLFGSERQLSNLLMQDLGLIEQGLVPLQQESPLHKGTIDIFARDKQGNYVVIELKRREASLASVSQLKRYVEAVGKRKGARTRGILCAPGISETAFNLLQEQQLEFFKLDYEISNPSAKIKGLQKKQNTLNEFV